MMRSGIIFCIIYIFISSIPEGKARRRFYSSEETGSNEKKILQQISKILQVNPVNDKHKAQQQLQENGQYKEAKKLKDYISHVLLGKDKLSPSQVKQEEPQLQDYISHVLGKNKLVPEQVSAEESPKNKPQSKWAVFWEVIKEAMNNVVKTLTKKRDSQVIVQPAKKDDEYSLLQNIKSGRVRGPVHVYGQHSKEASDE